MTQKLEQVPRHRDPGPALVFVGMCPLPPTCPWDPDILYGIIISGAISRPVSLTQVSHHPPVSAFYISNRKDGFCMSGSITAKSKFYGEEAPGDGDGMEGPGPVEVRRGLHSISSELQNPAGGTMWVVLTLLKADTSRGARKQRKSLGGGRTCSDRAAQLPSHEPRVAVCTD